MACPPPPSPDLDLERLLRRTDLGSEPEAHPTLKELERLHLGESEAPQAERLHAHIARCPECADQMLDLVTFLESPAPVPLSEDALEKAWRRHCGRHRMVNRIGFRSWSLKKSFSLAAASLLIALLGIGWWSVSVQRELRVPVVMERVILKSAIVRSPSVSAMILDAEAEDVVLQLQPRTQLKPTTEGDSPDTYRLLLKDVSGLVRHEIRGQLGPDPDIFLSLPGNLLPEGRYLIVLFSDDHSDSPWDTFEFEIRSR